MDWKHHSVKVCHRAVLAFFASASEHMQLLTRLAMPRLSFAHLSSSHTWTRYLLHLFVTFELKDHHHTHHNRFTALFPGPPGWAGAKRELLDFMVQGKINRGRHTDHPVGHHSIRTNQCPPPPSPHFYRPDALPAAQLTVSKHWKQLAHSD